MTGRETMVTELMQAAIVELNRQYEVSHGYRLVAHMSDIEPGTMHVGGLLELKPLVEAILHRRNQLASG